MKLDFVEKVFNVPFSRSPKSLDNLKAYKQLKQIIDANGYADKISVILDGMAKSTMSYNEFKDTLNLMVRNKLITQEFAMYYMNVRDKNSH